MNRLFIDLETCQARDQNVIDDVIANMKPPKNYKNQDTIDAWFEKNRDEVIKKTSFSGLAGEIICIGWAVDDGALQSVSRYVGGSEQELLKLFFDMIVDENGVNFNPEWVGHNLCDFDLRFLFQRCVINNVKPPISIPYNQQPWGRGVFDTLYETMGNNVSGGSLDRISKAFGLKGKTEGMDGSKVNQVWLDGGIEQISDYCKDDVELCRGIYKKLNFIDSVENDERPDNY
jgi:predicted PolB exonuclease-like 3'-5' exonuclease